MTAHDDLNGWLYYRTGTVSLDAPSLTRVLARPDGRAEVKAIIMHEFGHLVGLAHVDDSRELMYADNVAQRGSAPVTSQGWLVSAPDRASGSAEA